MFSCELEKGSTEQDILSALTLQCMHVQYNFLTDLSNTGVSNYINDGRILFKCTSATSPVVSILNC